MKEFSVTENRHETATRFKAAGAEDPKGANKRGAPSLHAFDANQQFAFTEDFEPGVD